MTGPDRLRPNEVAGTRDVDAIDAIDAIMREALGDDWGTVLIPWPVLRGVGWFDRVPPSQAAPWRRRP